MRKVAILFLFPFILLAGCTTHEGAAYIRKDLDAMKCNSLQPNIDIKTAKTDCMKYTVNDEADEYLRGGVSIATIDWIKEVHRRTYQECMSKNGYGCQWVIPTK